MCVVLGPYMVAVNSIIRKSSPKREDGLDPRPHIEEATQHRPLQAKDVGATFRFFPCFSFVLLVQRTLEMCISHIPLSQQLVSVKWP